MPYIFFRRFLLGTVLSVMLGACGQKGPLVMPPDDTKPAKPAEPAPPAETVPENATTDQDF